MALLVAQLIPTVILVVGAILLGRRTRGSWARVTAALDRDAGQLALRSHLRERAGSARLRVFFLTAAVVMVLTVGMALLAGLLAARREHGVLSVTEAYRAALDQLPFSFLFLAGLPLLTGWLVLSWIAGDLAALRAGQRVLATAGDLDGPIADLRASWGSSAVLLLGVVGSILALAFGAGVFVIAFSSAATAIACAQPGGSKCY